MPPDPPLAGFGWRVAQGVLDDLLVTTVALILAMRLGVCPSLAHTLVAGKPLDSAIAWLKVVSEATATLAIYVVLKTLYYWVAVGWCGQTLACWLLRLRIIGADGGPAGWARAGRRSVAGGIPGHVPGVGHVLRYIDYFAALATKRKQAVRDLAADTLLVHVRRENADAG